MFQLALEMTDRRKEGRTEGRKERRKEGRKVNGQTEQQAGR